MTKIIKRLFIISVMALSSATLLNAALTKDFYKKKSVLSEGKWVKIGVAKTGVYEISYAELRQMGFSNPEKVAVFGRGGRVLPESFVSNAGVPVLTDDLAAVKVLHDGDKLYFYGLGPEEIGFTSMSSYATGGFFTRKSNNIYSRRGYYFLTDSQSVQSMSAKNYDNPSNVIDNGISYVYHELDSVQNTTNTGQLFWGELVGHPGLQKRTWSAILPDALESKGVMECHMYFQDRPFGDDAYVSYGFTDTKEPFKTPYQINNSLYYSPHEPTIGQIDVPARGGNVFVEFAGEDMGQFTNLDFWVVSYRRSIPTMESVNQQLLAFPQIASKSTANISLSNPASLIVLDVSSPTDPQRLTIKQNGPTGTVGVKYVNSVPQIVIFDKTKTQYKISGYETDYSPVANQNLHDYKEKGTDYIIITTPRFKDYAEEIAALHREHDGIDVIVATTEQVYNEFSGGVPDPMAYRNFARMLYFTDRKPKNMLLLGPLYGDFRGLQSEHDPFEGIIAYQSPAISISRGAHNINDFYGMMDDKFRTDYYERNNVHIGVAILPLKFESEARIVVDKIRNHLERTDQAYYLNRYTAVSGIGDQHTHDIQIRDINTHIRQLDNYGTIFTPLSIDTYGNGEAQKKFFNQLNEGCGVFTYFGHGAEQFLGKDGKFFSAGDVYKLKNTVLPLAGFGGCQITNTDRGYRGLGETLVTATPHGCIGTIVSARDTWSGQNLEFFKQFFICLYKEGSTSKTEHNYDPVTIGEVYANVKHFSTYSNELAYQLLCDPALVIPTINRPISVHISGGKDNVLVPGEKMSFSGEILNKDGKTDSKYNGQVVLRLCEPEKLIAANNIESGEDTGGLQYYYRDEQISSAVAEVKDGKFEIEIHAPASLASFTAGQTEVDKENGPKALLYFTAFDPRTKTGAGQSYTMALGLQSAASTESTDNVPPVIESLVFNGDNCAISLAVSDNVALNLATNPLNKGLYLYIDGKERTEAHFAEAILESGRAAYSKLVMLDGIEYGDHTARLKVKDAAGNSSEQEITFTYQPAIGKYMIARSESSTPESTLIEAVGDMPVEAALVIMNSTGREIWRGDFRGGNARWNHEDNTGMKVQPGHYKAYIIETGASALKGHSETIDIPVI